MSPRRLSLGGALAALLVVAASTLEARPDDDRLQARWKQGSFLATRTRGFELQRVGATWAAEVLAPKDDAPHKVTLVHGGDGWRLEVRARVRATRGAAGVVAEEDAPDGWSWGPARVVQLEVKGDRLEAKGWRVQLPAAAPAPPSEAAPVAPVDPGALGAPEPELPVVRVLITGFDRFPRLRNHPTFYYGGRLHFREPDTNPSSYGVRTFDLAGIDPALRARCRIDLHRMVDVPVHYVEAAKLITDKIAEVDADVAISFGVGADGGADADVEAVCFNRMSDGSSWGSDGGEGPFRLPASWPPAGDPAGWSAEDRAWDSRYPDNAGVSYAGKKICPGAPDTLRSSLPIEAIAAAVERKGLRAIDDSSGPGNYICNNVMFEVVRAQAARGKLGGFVHLAGWSESTKDKHAKVVTAAVEESVKAVLAARAR